MFHSGGWYARLQYDEDQDRPAIDRALLRRVFEYGRPYKWSLVGVLATILVISALSVVPALLVAQLLDVAIPDKDFVLLTKLGAGMVAVPLVNALLGVVQRWLSSKAGGEHHLRPPGAALRQTPEHVVAVLHGNQDG